MIPSAGTAHQEQIERMPAKPKQGITVAFIAANQ